MTNRVKPFLINSGRSLKAAMKQLEETEERILFVVSDDERLVGSLTDGDMRRWILSDGSLDDAVDDACNRNPCFVGRAYNIESIKKTMLARKLGCIPVLDDGQKIVELLFWEVVFRDEFTKPGLEAVDVPVVIMAGGKGTRLDPFTRILPKPLIPVGESTVIEVIIERFVLHGVKEFHLSVNHKAKLIKSFFEELNPEYEVSYVEEEVPLGTAGSLRMLAGELQGPFFVTNCDVVISADYAEILAHHQENKNDLTLVGSMKTFRIPYGVCQIKKGGALDEIIEKPEYNFLISTGMYVMESDVLDLIPADQVFHTTDLIDVLKSRGGKVGVFPIAEGAWLDTGEWDEYRRAVQRLGSLTAPDVVMS